MGRSLLPLDSVIANGHGIDGEHNDGVPEIATCSDPRNLAPRNLNDVKTNDVPDGALDEGARFRELFESSYRPLVAYARRRASDVHEADDIVSEVFTVAWRRRDELRTDGPALPWLYGIAGNLLRNQWRSHNRRLRLVDRLESESEPARQLDASQSPDSGLLEALAQLSFDDQELLRLVTWENLSHAEIGEVLGCSTNAVGIRLHRARQRLKDEFEHQQAGTTRQAPQGPDTGNGTGND